MDALTYCSTRAACKFLDVTADTLRRWDRAGRITALRTAGNVRRYLVSDIKAMAGSKPTSTRYVYCRVSSHKQKDDLERQVAAMASKFPDHEVVRDVGSGLNFKRRGLLAILRAVEDGSVKEIVVASRDRLARFGFELISWICDQHATKLVVLEQSDGSPESELADDLMSIIQVFCCRRNGRRRYRVPDTGAQSRGDQVPEVTDEGQRGDEDGHQMLDGVLSGDV